MNCSPPLHPDGSRSSENWSGPCHEHLGDRQFSRSCMDIRLLGAMNKSFCLDLTLSNWAACVQGGEIRGDLGQGLVFAGEGRDSLYFSLCSQSVKTTGPAGLSLKCLPSTLLVPCKDSLLYCAVPTVWEDSHQQGRYW